MPKIRRLESKSGHFKRHREDDRNTGPERRAPQNDAIAIIASPVRFAIAASPSCSKPLCVGEPLEPP